MLGLGIFSLSGRDIQNDQNPSIVPTNDELFLRVDKIRDIKLQEKHIQTPESVRAVYMSSWIASSPKLRAGLIDFITESRINSLVLDIKDYSGLIAFDIDHPLIDEYDTDSRRIPDIHDFLQELHDKDIYVIGRLTVFQDPLLAKAKPEFAFKRKDNGKTWTDRKDLAFINPQKKDAWEYYAVIAEESYRLGFDEINFDYIRYPSDGNMKNLDYALGDSTKLSVMKSFYEFLDDRLRSQNIPISADLFGFTASRTGGLTIGQNLDDALPHFDAIAPMVYPSHYPNNYLGYANPAAHPYPIVKHEMEKAHERAKKLGLVEHNLRTWIQDFDMGAGYGVQKVQDQIRASYDAGVMSYMVWDPSNKYTKSAYYENLQNDTTQ
ncbi:MAG: putative glycoside hydrolase [Minisyncoccia bacterium]